MTKNMNMKSAPRKGAILPLMAVLLIVLISIAALTIDSNWMLYNVTNSQNSADLAARSSLVRIQNDNNRNLRVARARAIGKRIYDLNYDREGEYNADRILFGSLQDSTVTDPVFIENTSDRAPVSAVNVQAPTNIAQQRVSLFFGSLFDSQADPLIFADAVTGTRQIDIFLCLDASRSMNRLPNKGFPPGASSIHEPPLPGSRWFELKDTVQLFLAEIKAVNPNARVGLVTFGGGFPIYPAAAVADSPLDATNARLEIPLELVISDEIGAIVDTMNAYTNFEALGLGTSIYDGVLTSLQEFENDNASRQIILLSDGNQVIENRPSPAVAGQEALQAGVVVHTISFGGDFAALKGISTATGGSDFTAVTVEELREAFSQLLGRFTVNLVD